MARSWQKSNWFGNWAEASMIRNKKLSTTFGFVAFLDDFGRFSIQIAGAISTIGYGPRSLKSKISSKEPKNRQKRNSWTVSKKPAAKNAIAGIVKELWFDSYE